ncbi:MAG: threonine--tRNA ligase [Bdellovibrionales bacterium]|nr:threonine--tRNA ligase [Bdellovibrionales bacterium]
MSSPTPVSLNNAAAPNLSDLGLEGDNLSEVETMRHSCAHVMAHAISRIWPTAKFGIGPTIEDGFYYDFDIPEKLSDESLDKIEKEMFKIINANAKFERKEHSIDEAIAMFKELKQDFKVEIIQDLRDKFNAKTVSTYTEGEFTDLCRGPHIANTGKIKAFKLMSVAGAYWRGNEKNPMLQRIYGTAFASKQELAEYLHMLEEAKRRDHRKLGKELDLFSFHPEAPASPFFHPKGALLYNRLVEYVRKMYVFYGYTEVITPQIFDAELWKKSGHWDNYHENMYFTEVDERQFAVKPMNCPSHTFIYSSQKRSYRDLPLRIADFGRLHRYERSGVTSGLTRVRTFCQDDAHVFCRVDQIEQEINTVIDMIFKTYKIFDFDVENMHIEISTRPEKRMGSDELWDQSEGALRAVLDKRGQKYAIDAGGGAFYGPKIDFKIRDALKRQWQLATVQLDYNLPERFDCSYVGADNAAHRPVMIHRAVLGSLERFLGVMIEHFGGAFPFWLAPVQCRLVPITEAHHEYCKEFGLKLARAGIRYDIDDRNEKMGLKTREAQMAKIPMTLVAGDREMADGAWAIRKYGAKDSQVLKGDEIFAQMMEWNDIPRKPFEV